MIFLVDAIEPFSLKSGLIGWMVHQQQLCLTDQGDGQLLHGRYCIGGELSEAINTGGTAGGSGGAPEARWLSEWQPLLICHHLKEKHSTWKKLAEISARNFFHPYPPLV